MCFVGYHFTIHHMIYSRFEYLENRISLEGLKKMYWNHIQVHRELPVVIAIVVSDSLQLHEL